MTTSLEVSSRRRAKVTRCLRILDFDEADFSVPDPDAHPDEVVLPPPRSLPVVEASHHFNGPRNGNNAPSAPSNGTTPNHGKPTINRGQQAQQMPALNRPQNNFQAPETGGSRIAPQPPQPQAPNSGFVRSMSGASAGTRPLQDPAAVHRVINPRTGTILNQPNRPAAASAPGSPARTNGSSSDPDDPGMPPPGAGFTSARAASMLPQGQVTEGQANLPAFDPKIQSTSIKRTPGVDHTSSKPLSRQLKHLPGGSQAPTPAATATTTTPGSRLVSMNQQLDGMRRIGAPGSPSPMANRSSYKPPTMKRPVDNVGGTGPRTPLTDLSANGHISGGDAKRQRLSG